MVTTKPRSSEIPQSKTISVSKSTKEVSAASVTSSNSSKSLERKPSTKGKALSEKRIDKVSSSEMQESQSVDLQDDLKKVKEQLVLTEVEKNRALDELREMKKVSDAANFRLSEALSAQAQTEGNSRLNELEQMSILSAKKRDQAWQLELEAVKKQHALDMEELDHIRKELALTLEDKEAALKAAEEARNIAQINAQKVLDLSAEISLLKEALDDSSEDMELRDKDIVRLKVELEKAKQAEAGLVEKEASIENLKQELVNAREPESESKLRLQTLGFEVEKAKELERKMLESLNCQTKQLEETKILLEESKLEVTTLQEKLEGLEDLVGQTSRDLDASQEYLKKAQLEKQVMEGTVEALKSELQAAKDILAHEQDGAEPASEKACSLAQQMGILRNELKLAIEAEEKSKKAMDDLALALIEVTKENKEMKEKLNSTQSDLGNVRQEAEHLKQTMKINEEKSQELLDEAKKEFQQVKDEAERLKLEADDSIVSWNLKELEFVNCIKRAEDESNALKHENTKLTESLKSAENVAKLAREENNKLRDILKQAINEASIAKEAAEIAKSENSQLKDSLLDKDNVLQHLVTENEHLRINEAAAFENIKELKRMLSTSTTSSTDMKAEDNHLAGTLKKENSVPVPVPLKKENSVPIPVPLKKENSVPVPTVKENNFHRKLSEVLSFQLEELKIPNGGIKKEEEDPEKAEMLKGSIFDVADSPVAAPTTHHRKTSSSAFTDDGEAITLEDLDNFDGSQLDDMDNDRNSQRKKKALLRRFGDLIRKTSFHKKEPSIG